MAEKRDINLRSRTVSASGCRGKSFPGCPGRLPGKHNYSSTSRQKAEFLAAIDSKIESKIRLGIIEEHDKNTMVILQPQRTLQDKEITNEVQYEFLPIAAVLILILPIVLIAV